MTSVFIKMLNKRFFSALMKHKLKMNGTLKRKRPAGLGTSKRKDRKNVLDTHIFQSQLTSIHKSLRKLSRHDKRIDKVFRQHAHRLHPQSIKRESLMKRSVSARRQAYNEILACSIDLCMHGCIDPNKVKITLESTCTICYHATFSNFPLITYMEIQ